MTPEKLKQRRLERDARRRKILLEEWWAKHGGYQVLTCNPRDAAGQFIVTSPDTQISTSIDWPLCSAITAIVFAVLVMIWRHF